MVFPRRALPAAGASDTEDTQMQLDAQPPAYGDGPVLSHLPEETVRSLFRAGVRRAWRRRQYVVRRGDHIDAVMIVLEGRLRASTIMADGEENLLGWLRDHELFGTPNVLGGMPFAVNIMADGPAATLHVAREDFIEIVRDDPAAAIGIATALSYRLLQLFEVIEASGHRTLGAKVHAHLWRLAEQHGRRDAQGRIALSIAQSDLAAAVGASRQRVHLELRKLEAQGLVALAYHRITLMPEAAAR